MLAFIEGMFSPFHMILLGRLDFPTFPSAFGPGVGNSVGSLPVRPEPVEIGQASAANG
jgi:hypothetical protein